MMDEVKRYTLARGKALVGSAEMVPDRAGEWCGYYSYVEPLEQKLAQLHSDYLAERRKWEEAEARSAELQKRCDVFMRGLEAEEKDCEVAEQRIRELESALDRQAELRRQIMGADRCIDPETDEDTTLDRVKWLVEQYPIADHKAGGENGY